MAGLTTMPKTAARMSRQRRRDTAPEVALRTRLHKAGYRYRVNYRIPEIGRRTIDIAFTRVRIAVFVDGCFWHACPRHATWPKTNGEWWRAKLAANSQRDRDTDGMLRENGWAVIRVWEHEDPAGAFDRVRILIETRRSSVLGTAH